MTIKEAKSLISRWLKDKDYKRIHIPGGAPYNYIHNMEEFNVLVSYFKDRFDNDLIFHVGCHFDDCEYGDATIRVINLPSNKHKIKKDFSLGLYFEELTEEDFLRCLDEMFEKYLKPYYDKGKNYLKEIILNPSQFNDCYQIEKDARNRINQMFGLHTKP